MVYAKAILLNPATTSTKKGRFGFFSFLGMRNGFVVQRVALYRQQYDPTHDVFGGRVLGMTWCGGCFDRSPLFCPRSTFLGWCLVGHRVDHFDVSFFASFFSPSGSRCFFLLCCIMHSTGSLFSSLPLTTKREATRVSSPRKGHSPRPWPARQHTSLTL